MNEYKTVIVLSRDAKKRTEEISRFGYSLVSSKPITAGQAKRENPDAVVSKDDEHYSEITFTREMDMKRFSEIKHLEMRYFAVVDENVPSLKIAELIVQICAFSIFGIPFLPFALVYRRKLRKKVMEATSINMSNDNTRRSLSMQAEMELKRY